MKRSLARMMRKTWQAINRVYSVRGKTRVGKNVHIGTGTIIDSQGGLVIEHDVYIGKYCTIECNGRIGNGTLVANCVGVIGRLDHDYHTIGRTMRDAPWIGDPDFSRPPSVAEIIIGADCWIGFGAILLTGVTIGRGTVVAAGAVVTKDVAPYSIVAGVPARRVGMRFTEEQQASHERILAERANAR